MEASPIQKQLAFGKIPIVFDMHESEVTALHRPPPFYVMAPRLCYLPLVSRSARESFEEAAPDIGESGVWYEHEGKPLRWNLPIGVLFDYHSNNDQEDVSQLPFKITIRFQGFPKMYILPCTNELDVEKMFFNSMKQALSLRYGTSKSLMDMPQVSQETLWDGVVLGRFDKYWSSANLLYSQPEILRGGQTPIRVLVKENNIISNEGARMFQSSVPFDDMITFKDAVDIVLKSNSKIINWEASRLIVQGVEPPWDVPIREITQEMCAHDLFLYVVVICSS